MTFRAKFSTFFAFGSCSSYFGEDKLYLEIYVNLELTIDDIVLVK